MAGTNQKYIKSKFRHGREGLYSLVSNSQKKPSLPHPKLVSSFVCNLQDPIYLRSEDDLKGFVESSFGPANLMDARRVITRMRL